MRTPAAAGSPAWAPAPPQRHLPRRRDGLAPARGVPAGRRGVRRRRRRQPQRHLRQPRAGGHRRARQRRGGADRQVPPGLPDRAARHRLRRPGGRAGVLVTAIGASGSLAHGDRHGRAALSIGSVLDALREDFPEITISKIRFLESEGLISPSRTPSGYRQFSHADVRRLRFVLSAQRDHYLPLKVIRAKLDEFDQAPTADGPVLTASAEPVSPAEALGGTTPESGGPGGPGGPGGDGPRGG